MAVEAATKGITQDVTQGRKTEPGKALELQPIWMSISTWLGSLGRSGEQLAAKDAAFARLNTQIESDGKVIGALKSEVGDLKGENQELKRSSTRAAEAWLAWMVAGCALVIGAGVVCLLSGT